MNETYTASYRILLSNIHTNRKELRHLRTRTTRNYEILYALATIPRMDQGNFHYPYRSCKPPILESSEESQSTNCTMACRPPRIRLQNQTHPWKHKHPSRCLV